MNLRHHNSSGASLVTQALLVVMAITGTQAVWGEASHEAAGTNAIANAPAQTLSAGADDGTTLDDAASPLPQSPQDSGEAADPDLMVESTVADLVSAYLDQIDRQQSLIGTYAPGLSESLSGLARLLQVHGDHEGAVAAYQQAMHIQRVNDGIYSIGQEPMLRGMITSSLALGDLESVTGHFDELLWLYGKGYGDSDPRLLPLVAEISDWHLQAYNHNPNRKGLQHLVRAHNLVANTINRVSVPVGGGKLTVLPLLRNLVVTNYYMADHQRRYPVGAREGFSMRVGGAGAPEPLSEDEMLMINSYQNGRRAQEHIVATLMADPDATTMERVDALAELGDWYLLFGRADSAQRAYRDAWQLAAADPDVSPLVDDLFGAPRIIALQPASLRAAAANLNDEHTVQILTRLNIGIRGDVRGTEIVAMSPDHDPKLSARASRELKKLRFRPRLINGTMTGAEGIAFTLALQQD